MCEGLWASSQLLVSDREWQTRFFFITFELNGRVRGKDRKVQRALGAVSIALMNADDVSCPAGGYLTTFFSIPSSLLSYLPNRKFRNEPH